MRKEVFVAAIDAIQKQMKQDVDVSKYLGKAFPDAFDANLMPRNHLLQNALILVLQEHMGDTILCSYGLTWIEYFCFELDFGKKSRELKAFYKGKRIPLSNAGQLWKFLANKWGK